MKTFTRVITVCMVSVVVVFCLMMLFHSNEHPLSESIGLAAVEDSSESSINVGKRALVFSKKQVDYDLYEFICEKAAAMYGAEVYKDGVEVSQVPEFDLIDGKYSQNPTRAFLIDSQDQYVSIWVVDYAEYVAVVFIQARI